MYLNSVDLDRLYRSKHPDLMRMYADFEQLLTQNNIHAIVVTDAPPFHPDYLRNINVYKVLYSQDDPESTYMRNIPYLHAYHHVFYATPTYSRELNMAQKMRETGMINSDFVPIGALDIDYDALLSEEQVFALKRDIDIVFIGTFHRKKIETLVRLKKYFKQRFCWKGYYRLTHKAYINVRYGAKCWPGPVSYEERLRLHQRARIGVNIHNGYDLPNLGNNRLYHIPANGALQLTDGVDYLDYIYEAGTEVVGYRDIEDLIEKIEYYLSHEKEREQISRNGYRRVMKEYRFSDITRSTGLLIQEGMKRINWQISPP
ncbi:MAG: glycosyltransferase family 1 protein [Sedimentisphaerales bacterium]|nr:glycosyltransferase family 1 protein [Sedimentisphaerales bacterium]